MAASEKKQRDNKISIGDILLSWSDSSAANSTQKILDQMTNKQYRIEGKKVINALLIECADLVIFETETKAYYRDMSNYPIIHSESWVDYYYEPITSSFYRKDERENWYDIEGFRIRSTIILKGNVLMSLRCKSASQNMLFENAELLTSPNELIIQVGKTILNDSLQPIQYFGDILTGLGSTCVLFDNGVIYQQVKLSLTETAYINEQNKLPIIINGESIKSYIKQIKIGTRKYHLFRSDTSSYLLDSATHQNLELHTDDHEIDESSYVKIQNDALIKIEVKNESYFVNLSTKQPYHVAGNEGKKVRKIKKSNVTIDNEELLNIELDDNNFVLNSHQSNLYKLSSGILPEKIKNLPGFENTLALIYENGKSYLFSLISQSIVEVGSIPVSVKAIDGYLNNKLINATDQNDRKVVLDVREGYSTIELALSKQTVISEMIGLPKNIGSKILQNARIETLGGEQNCVIDLNDPTLSEFTFPSDMTIFNEGGDKSIFSNTPLLKIDFDKKIKIEDQSFFIGKFRSYNDELQSVVLQSENGKPLFLEGSGHKNELVTGFKTYTLNDKYWLGNYRMIGVSTLREDLKSNEILFALELMSSWIPFYDTYLPIFRKIVEFNDQGEWEYQLFELGEISNDKEYIAAEKVPPYRILINKKGSKRIPKVVKSREKTLKSPEEISTIKKLFFNDPGILEEV